MPKPMRRWPAPRRSCAATTSFSRARQRGVPPLRRSDGEQETVKVDAGEFLKLPPAVARRVARYALETVNPSRTYGLEEADELRRVVATGPVPIFLAGVERFGAGAVLVSRRRSGGRRRLDPLEFRLEIPGTVEAPLGRGP